MIARYSLKTRVALIATAVSWAAFLFIALLFNGYLNDYLQRQLGEQQHSITSLLATEIDEELEVRITALETIAQQITPEVLRDPAELQGLLAQRPLLNQLFSGGTFAARKDGAIIADVSPSGSRQNTYFLHLETLDIPLKEGRSSVGSPMHSPVLHAPALNVAVPIRDGKGHVTGALAGAINLGQPNFFDKIAKAHYGRSGGYLVISPESNRFVAATDKSRVMQPIPAPGLNAMHDRYMKGYEGYGIAVNSQGIEELSAAKRIERANWFVVTVIPTAEAFGSIDKLKKGAVVLLLVLALVIGTAVWIALSWYLKKELAPLARVSKSNGDHPGDEAHDRRLSHPSTDEVGELVVKFRRLLAALSQRKSELHENEELFRAISQSAHDAIITADSDGKILKWNKGAEQIFGYAESEVIGQSLTLLIPARYRQRHDEGLVRVRDGHKPRVMGSPMEMHGLRKNGEEFPIELSISDWTVPRGHFFTGVIRDITERKRFEQQREQYSTLLEAQVKQRTEALSKALDEAKVAEKTKDAFLANMSHELRTPLNAVIGMAMISDRLATDPKQKDSLKKIVAAGKHLNRIINDLLDLSKIAAGRLEIENLAFRVRDVAEQTKSLLSARADTKGIELVVHVDDNVPDVLVGDRVRVEQILLNLVSNALKFTEQGHVRVDLRLAGLSGSRACLTLTVEDTGIGIEPADLEKLFQPFTQVDQTIQRRFGGTGLGLTISRRLAQKMGGDISVRSTIGMGTTFTTTLWLGVGSGEDLNDLKAEPLAANSLRLQGVRALVVDDQLMNREVCEAILSDAGATCDFCENGKQALDKLTAEGPGAFNVVLMDIQMPEMDGLTATREIRKMPGFERLPIIAMTAYTMTHEIADTLACGMTDHVGKPIDDVLLKRKVAMWVSPDKPVGLGGDVVIPLDESGCAGKKKPLHIDVSQGIRHFGGQEQRYWHWAGEFLRGAESLRHSLAEVSAHKDAAGAKAILHKLKTQSFSLGLNTLGEQVRLAEEVLGSTDSDVVAVLSRLEAEVCKATTDLEEIMRDRRGPVVPVARGDAEWDSRLALGVPHLDRHHQHLFALTKEISAIRSAGIDTVADQVLADIFDYAREHFAAEESHMEEHSYPKLEQHRREHMVFFEKVTEFSVCAGREPMSNTALAEFLTEWLLAHIAGSDLEYAQFLRDAGRD